MLIKPNRKMPSTYNLGRHQHTTVGFAISRREQYQEGRYDNPKNLRVVMGFMLPEWQRGLVWSEAQQISFIESMWLGLNIGTFSYTSNFDIPELDNLLIDGQQRMYAIECYMQDKFKVFGHYRSELTPVDWRVLELSIGFASYVLDENNEDELKAYYNRMNFGGVAHKEGEQAR